MDPASIDSRSVEPNSAPTVHLSLPGPEQLPPELQGRPPREVPRAIKQGRVAQKSRNVFWGFFVAGLLCIAIDGLPFVETLSLYILPLAYLLWIGLALCAMAAFGFFYQGAVKKARRYIEGGEAAFARVLKLVKIPTMMAHGQPTLYAIAATVQLRHPETGETVARQVNSQSFSASRRDQVSTRFRVGDAVPVVWIPGKFDRTLQLYDFLEVMPERSLVYQSNPQPLWVSTLVAILVASVFLTLLWGLFAIERYSPIDFDWVAQGGIPLTIGGCLGLAVAVALAVFFSRRQRRQAERNAEAARTGNAIEVTVAKGKASRVLRGALVGSGAIMLGCVVAMSVCLTINAALDRSQAKLEMVRITQMVEITHEAIFREYKLKYRRANDASDQEFLTTPRHLQEFTIPVGIAHVKSGRLGWHWVEAIAPIRVAPNPGGAAPKPQ
jgi:hypothetical protein